MCDRRYATFAQSQLWAGANGLLDWRHRGGLNSESEPVFLAASIRLRNLGWVRTNDSYALGGLRRYLTVSRALAGFGLMRKCLDPEAVPFVIVSPALSSELPLLETGDRGSDLWHYL